MHLCDYAGTAWRFVEDQYLISTMKLAGSLEDQRTLEELLDDSKPPVPEACRGLHFLQFTPFRYRARYASRFRPAGDANGVFYAAEDVETSAAEFCFYRVLFFLESPGLAMSEATLAVSSFSTEVATARAVDLTAADWDGRRGELEDPVAYGPCHGVMREARAAGAGLIRFRSVRLKGRCNLAVLECAAFASAEVSQPEGWKISVRPDRVIARKVYGGVDHEFTVAQFMDDPRISRAVAQGALSA
ncbi:MAG: RES family NAD+ phosphorylase [Pseudomonadota bacterium]